VAFHVLPLWDQAAALAALNGNQEHVATLRGMFLDELGRQHEQVLSALHSANHEGAKQVLHQLKASSGFVGAMRLNAAAAALEKSLSDAEAIEQFSTIVRETSAAENP
jgi:HPt (histidine-containing phosphotransfer) domain-containing protein